MGFVSLALARQFVLSACGEGRGTAHVGARYEMRADRVDRRMVEEQCRRHLGRVLLSDHARELGRRERIEPRIHQRCVRPQLLAHQLTRRGQHAVGHIALSPDLPRRIETSYPRRRRS